MFSGVKEATDNGTQVITKYYLVNRQVALRWLGLKSVDSIMKNRNTPQGWTLMLANEILAGMWFCPASKVVWTEDLELIDGHRTLEAIVVADRTVLVQVLLNWPKRLAHKCNASRINTIPMAFQMYRSVDRPKLYGEACSALYSLFCAQGDMNKLHIGRTAAMMPVTFEQADTVSDVFAEELIKIISVVCDSPEGVRLRKSVIVATLSFIAKSYPAKGEAFLLDVLVAADPNNGHRSAEPAAVLGEWLCNTAKFSSHADRRTVAMVILDAFVAYNNGDKKYEILPDGHAKAFAQVFNCSPSEVLKNMTDFAFFKTDETTMKKLRKSFKEATNVPSKLRSEITKALSYVVRQQAERTNKA